MVNTKAILVAGTPDSPLPHPSGLAAASCMLPRALPNTMAHSLVLARVLPTQKAFWLTMLCAGAAALCLVAALVAVTSDAREGATELFATQTLVGGLQITTIKEGNGQTAKVSYPPSSSVLLVLLLVFLLQ